MALTSERHTNRVGGCCPDCGRQFAFSPQTVAYDILAAGGENTRLLTLRCLACPWQAAWRVDDDGNPVPTDATAVQPKDIGESTDLSDEDFELTRRALRFVRQNRRIETLEKKLAGLEEKSAAKGPKGFEGLGHKIANMSSFFHDANLTDKQQEVASLKWEYGLPLAEVAARLRKHHSTVQYLLSRADYKLGAARSRQKTAKQRAKSAG
jgi:DNA-binding CsgD family transcriptional regulator